MDLQERQGFTLFNDDSIPANIMKITFNIKYQILWREQLAKSKIEI